MDLNELLHAHQVSVMEASAAGDDLAKQDHFEMVALYAQRIRELREFHLQSQLPPTSLAGETIVYGTYAGDPAPMSGSLTEWENEGGAIKSPAASVPPGVTLAYLPQYYVGPYVYSDLALAVAEHGRQARSLSYEVID